MPTGTPTLGARRFRALVMRLLREGATQHAIGKRLGLSQASISGYVGHRKNADTATIEKACERMKLEPRFFSDASIGEDPDYKAFLKHAAGDERSAVRQAPESYRRWRKTEAPVGLTAEVESEMLAMYVGGRLPWADSPANVEPWGEVYRLARLAVQHRQARSAGG